jgi:hypothetical protein
VYAIVVPQLAAFKVEGAGATTGPETKSIAP